MQAHAIRGAKDVSLPPTTPTAIPQEATLKVLFLSAPHNFKNGFIFKFNTIGCVENCELWCPNEINLA